MEVIIASGLLNITVLLF